MNVAELLREMAESSGGKADANLSKNDRIGMVRLHNMSKLVAKPTATRYECQAALLSAAEELNAHWPKQWENKDEHLAFLNACTKAIEVIGAAKTAAEVSTAFKMTLLLQNELDTKLSDAARELLKRVASAVLFDLADADARRASKAVATEAEADVKK